MRNWIMKLTRFIEVYCIPDYQQVLFAGGLDLELSLTGWELIGENHREGTGDEKMVFLGNCGICDRTVRHSCFVSNAQYGQG